MFGNFTYLYIHIAVLDCGKELADLVDRPFLHQSSLMRARDQLATEGVLDFPFGRSFHR